MEDSRIIDGEFRLFSDELAIIDPCFHFDRIIKADGILFPSLILRGAMEGLIDTLPYAMVHVSSHWKEGVF